MKFNDLFSKQSSEYAKYRPSYPKELFTYIISLCKGSSLAWDCATGNGQAAVAIAKHFDRVIASDASASQINNAFKKDNISYQVFNAEKTPLEDSSVDLITVAQAIHWFDFKSFYREVKRVAKAKAQEVPCRWAPWRVQEPRAIIAIWGYGLSTIETDIDKEIFNFYENVVGDYWPTERKHIEASYATIEFPFEEIAAPSFSIKQYLTVEEYIAYLFTWSSVQKFIEEEKRNPLEEFSRKLLPLWPLDLKKEVRWPIHLKVAKVEKGS